MKRLIERNLEEWKDQKNRKPLIVRGVRQVGKTYSIREFGEKHFDNFIILDFERYPQFRRIFHQDLDPVRICREIEVIRAQKITRGNSLLFFDEIQQCPEALHSLRYFYEEMPDLHVIVAGSLLEFLMQDIAFPVGRVQFLWIRPMIFYEFLLATGMEEAAGIISASPSPVTKSLNDFLLECLRKYWFTGGMPESVKVFSETGSYTESLQVIHDIILSYRQDFTRYKPHVDPECLDNVLISLASRTGFQTKYSSLAEGYTNPTIKKAIYLLEKANLIHFIPSVTPSGIPLQAGASAKTFKTVLVDLGMMHVLCGLTRYEDFLYNDLMKLYKGALAEQFIGQELVHLTDGKVFYWSRLEKSSTAEIDYLIENQGQIYPIEVKNAPSGRLKSLHLLLKTYPDISQGYIYYTGNYSKSDQENLTFLPLYFSMKGLL